MSVYRDSPFFPIMNLTMSAPVQPAAARRFPPFSLSRLLRTVFAPKNGERICILIDLVHPRDITSFRFLEDPTLTIQRHAYEVFHQGLQHGVMAELGLGGGEMFAYQITGGSNLDLPDDGFASDGRLIKLATDVYERYDIILCISTYSATAPLTAFAKRYGFRGATMHGMNEVIINSGLAVDYFEVSAQAEKMRRGLSRAESIEIDFAFLGANSTLRLALGGQEAQKSHGLCRGGPDIANLPAGEVYFVPVGAEGDFPMRYEDGTLGLLHVSKGRVTQASWLRGSAATIEAHNAKLKNDPVTGELGELGFGTQELPVAGRDIQDEKILGTLHVATGRSDHLGGPLTPDRFATPLNATHDDILFSPAKTPQINVPQVRLMRGGETVVLLENYTPAAWLRRLLAD